MHGRNGLIEPITHSATGDRMAKFTYTKMDAFTGALLWLAPVPVAVIAGGILVIGTLFFDDPNASYPDFLMGIFRPTLAFLAVECGVIYFWRHSTQKLASLLASAALCLATYVAMPVWLFWPQ